MQPRDAHTQQKSLTQGEKEGPVAWQSTEEGACGSVILFFVHCAVNEMLLPISLPALCPEAHSARLPSALTCLHTPTHSHSSPIGKS